jgi:alkylation response protein AidB-like acyl-CoA dehydrogenase
MVAGGEHLHQAGRRRRRRRLTSQKAEPEQQRMNELSTHLAPAISGSATSGEQSNDELLRAIGGIADDLAPRAHDIDTKGIYPTDALRQFGAAGGFGAHLAAHTSLPSPSLGMAIKAMARVAETCMSTAFCIWCQDACAWYLENTENHALRDRLQPNIAAGLLFGGTGLSNPVKALSGIERFRLRAKRATGGYLVTGTLPWVSNLGDGHWFGTVFEDADQPEHKMMAMVECGAPGVTIRQDSRFIALEGTGTVAVHVKDAFIADDAMLADPLGGMVRRIKPGFILLQTGMGLGVINACIGLMRNVSKNVAASNKYLPRGVDWFEAELADLSATIDRLAATPLDGSQDYMRDVLYARLRCSTLALEASQGALLHQGALGYLEESPVGRRLRESYFVAIITPSIKHLRQEIAMLEKH